MPAVRAARGEVLSHVQVDWDTPGGLRTVLVSGSTISLDGGRRVTVVTFEDVTALEGARRRSSLLADELRVVLDNVADAITVQSPDHKLIYANEAAARHYGIPGGSELSEFDASVYLRRFEATDELGRPLDLARLPGRLALAGLDPEPVVVRSRDLETGEVRWARIKATAVHDPDGGVRLAINVIEDITELKRSEEAQRFLAEASRRLSGSSLDYERTLAAVGELAVPALADACAVHLVEEDGLPAEVAEVMRTRRGLAGALADDRADDLRARDRDADADAARARVRLRRRAGGRGLRAARGGGGGERAALSRRLADRAHAADLAAAAGAAGRAGRDARGGVPPRRPGARGRRRLLRRVHHRRAASGTW